MKTYEVLKNTTDINHDEWLESRRLGIGGSDASAIVGLNPWSSPAAVFADKLGVTPEKEVTEAMRMGTDLEQYVADRFTEATGKKVRRRNAILRSIEHPFMLANVDRLIVGEDAGLECKTTSPWNHAEWETGEVPANYYCQCCHYMAVTGCKTWYLAVLVFGKGFYWYRIERNEEDIAALIEAEHKFWYEHVVPKNPPEPDGSDASAVVIRNMYTGEGDGGAEVALTGMTNDLNRLEEIRKLKKSLDTEAAAIEQRIQMQMGDAHYGHAPGWSVSWKPYTSRRIDTKRLKTERPEIYEEYSKESTSRRFMPKKEAV